MVADAMRGTKEGSRRVGTGAAESPELAKF